MNPRVFAFALLAIVLGACQPAPAPPADKDDAQAALPPPPASPASEPGSGARDEMGQGKPHLPMPTRDTKPVDAVVTQVQLSNQGDTENRTLGTPTKEFGRHDTVYAQIQTSGSATDYTLYAKWMTPDGNVLSDYGMHVTGPGDRSTVISLSKPDGWAAGTHRIELAINGKAQQAATFVVR